MRVNILGENIMRSVKDKSRSNNRVFRLFDMLGEVYIFNVMMLLLSFVFMAIIVNYNFSYREKAYQMNYNLAALEGIENLMQEQEKLFLRILQEVYLSALRGEEVLEYLEVGVAGEETNLKRNYLSEFLHKTNFTDFASLSLYSGKDDRSYTYINRRTNTYNDDIIDGMRNIYNDQHTHLEWASGTIAKKHGKDRSYGMLHCLRSLDTYENIGAIQLEYKTSSIDTLIRESYPEVMGDFLVIGSNDEVFYDSTGSWYDQAYPYAKLISAAEEMKTPIWIDEKEYYINLLQNTDDLYKELRIYGIIGVEEVYHNTRLTINYMITVIGLMLIIMSIVMFINARMKSHILLQIYDGMKRIKEGDLDAKIELSGKKKGELVEIVHSFNEMTVDLRGYIEREYHFKMEQQEYLLMALQAQIDPHFLANSFEAIRMKAMLDGKEEIEEMVLILSRIFRNAAKGETVISIGNEIDNCESFLHLHKIRFQERLSYRLEVSEEVRQFAIVRHALQVIVENYMLYSFDGERDNNEITIQGIKENGYIVLIIRDNSHGVTQEKLEEMRRYIQDPQSASQRQHIGLGNVNQRMRIVFGSDFEFDIDSEYNEGLVERLKFRALLKTEVNNVVQSDFS